MTGLTILKTGSTIPGLIERRGDFEDWFRIGVAPSPVQVIAAHRGESLPHPRDVGAVIVTGSPSMVTDDETWSLAAERWLREVVELDRPVLGVCYGHQLLARAFGGTVADNPRGREIGTIDVRLDGAGHALFEGLPDRLVVHASHLQSVTELPTDAVRLGGNAHDPHQAFAIGERAVGVQFHPEFDADIVRSYIRGRSEDLRREGLDPDQLEADARDSEHGRRILRNFVDLAGRG